jgi:hypothetical protein
MAATAALSREEKYAAYRRESERLLDATAREGLRSSMAAFIRSQDVASFAQSLNAVLVEESQLPMYAAIAPLVPPRFAEEFQRLTSENIVDRRRATTGSDGQAALRIRAFPDPEEPVDVNDPPPALRADIVTSVMGSTAARAALRARIARSQTVSVFLSSPFGGLEQERSIFVEQHLPRLRRQCEAVGVSLAVVDLRWGITEQQAAQFETLRICLNEIDRCDIFVGCYGSRYGSRHNIGNKHTHWVASALDCALPKYPWLDRWRHCGITEIEYRHGYLNDAGVRPAMFLFRDKAYDEKAAAEARRTGNLVEAAKYENADGVDARLRLNLEAEIRNTAAAHPENNTTAMSYKTPVEAAQQMFNLLSHTLSEVCLTLRSADRQRGLSFGDDDETDYPSPREIRHDHHSCSVFVSFALSVFPSLASHPSHNLSHTSHPTPHSTPRSCLTRPLWRMTPNLPCTPASPPCAGAST